MEETKEKKKLKKPEKKAAKKKVAKKKVAKKKVAKKKVAKKSKAQEMTDLQLYNMVSWSTHLWDRIVVLVYGAHIDHHATDQAYIRSICFAYIKKFGFATLNDGEPTQEEVFAALSEVTGNTISNFGEYSILDAHRISHMAKGVEGNE